jgi:hypothetical protein
MNDSQSGVFAKHAVGQSVLRTEDPRLLRDEGRYTAAQLMLKAVSS